MYKARNKKNSHKREEAGATPRSLLPSIMKKIYLMNNVYFVICMQYKKEA